MKATTIRWLTFLVGALIITSSLPDEFGLALIGISKIRIHYLFITSFLFNALGILVISGIVLALN